MDANPGPPAHDPYAPLRISSYRRYLLAGICASAGAEAQVVAVGWELYERTRSATALGLVGLAMVVPVILLALPAGHAADRHDRKTLWMSAQGLTLACSLGLAAVSATRGPIPLVYVCLILAGVAQAISMTSRGAILRQLVPDHLVGVAVTWNSSGWQVASVAGPTLGGLIYAWHGSALPVYLLDASLAMVVVILLAPIRPRAIERVDGPIGPGSLTDGVRFVMSSRLLLATITLDLFAVFLGGAVALLPIFSDDILRIGAFGSGCLRAAPALGAAIMALTLAHRPPLRRAGSALLWSVAGFGLATVGFGLSRNAYLSFLMLALTGAFDNISVVVRSTLAQILVPDRLRGRVAAVNSIFIGCSNELGAFESGLTTTWFGPIGSVVGGGFGSVLVVIAARTVWPELGRLGSMADLAWPEAHGEAEAAAAADAEPAVTA